MLSTKFAVSGRAGFPERLVCRCGRLPVGRQQDAELVLIGPCAPGSEDLLEQCHELREVCRSSGGGKAIWARNSAGDTLHQLV
jgi:hypothetical protein